MFGPLLKEEAQHAKWYNLWQKTEESDHARGMNCRLGGFPNYIIRNSIGLLEMNVACILFILSIYIYI